jgi:type IV secretion system protein VirB2
MISKTPATSHRNALALACLVSALAATSPVMAQALEPVARAANIARDTVVGITLVMMTIAVVIAAYKIMFAGANFRDVSNLVFGGAVAGGAAAIAAVFMG